MHSLFCAYKPATALFLLSLAMLAWWYMVCYRNRSRVHLSWARGLTLLPV
jgi:hypothetical protein